MSEKYKIFLGGCEDGEELCFIINLIDIPDITGYCEERITDD